MVVKERKYLIVGAQDVAWHMTHKHLFGSVGDDKKLMLYVLYPFLDVCLSVL